MASTPGIDPLLTASTPASGQPAAPNAEKLKALAAQFESLFLSQMLREMRGSTFGDNDDEEEKESGFGDSPLADTMYSQLSVALSQAGGIGIAQSMIGSLMQQAGSTDSSATGGLTMGTDPLSAAMAAAATASMPVAPELAAPGSSFIAPVPSVAAPVVPVPVVPAPAPPSSSPAPAVTPMPGRVSSNYGWRRDPIDGETKFHDGVDLALPSGTEVPAARAGQVAFAGEKGGYGLTVEVDHGDGVTTRYAHLSQLDVKAGDTVAAGQTIALSGSTGRSTGPHLHFEVLDGGQSVDPGTGWALLQSGSGLKTYGS